MAVFTVFRKTGIAVERCPVAWLQAEELVPGWPCLRRHGQSGVSMSCTKFPLDFSTSFLHPFFSISIRPSTLVFFPPTFRQISFVSPFWSRTENHPQRRSGVLRQTSLLCWPTPNPRSASRSVGIATRSTLLFLPVSLFLSLCIVDWIVLRREHHQVPPPRILANLQFQYQLACNLLG